MVLSACVCVGNRVKGDEAFAALAPAALSRFGARAKSTRVAA